jgi:MFS family permease
MGKRVPFVQFGYALSSIAKPLLVAFTSTVWVFCIRVMDRLGKGIRTGARDAMLSDAALPGTKGRVFGFHRMMDTFGAVFGPAIALVYLHFNPGSYKALFLIAIIPGILVIATTFLLRENPGSTIKKSKGGFALSFLHYWKESPAMYRKVVMGLVAFALFNSSDVFLLLRLQAAGLTDTQVIGAFIFYNLVYALLSWPFGSWADKIGLKKMFILGLVMFAVMYFGMAIEASLYFYLALFICYGVYSAATDGIAKAWISTIADPKDTATAIGLFSGFQSIGLLIASTLTGLLWYGFGPGIAFFTTGVITVMVIIYFILLKE